MKEIVIAAYDRNLDWMTSFNSDIKQTIYRKGARGKGDNEILIEPNLGRCVHTFFNHILINYDNLSDVTFFAQDFPFDHWEDLVGIINGDIIKQSTLNIGGYNGYHYNSIGTMWPMPPSKQFDSGNVISCYSNGYPQDHNPLIDVDKYWDILFDCEKPLMYEFIPGGHFSITKEHAQLRSKALYKKVTELLIEDINAPWMIERLECYIFNPKYKTKL